MSGSSFAHEVTIADDDVPPTAGFATTAVTVEEGPTAEVTLTVELSRAAPAGGIALTWRTVAGTTAATGATAGEDYTAFGEGTADDGTLTIDAGQRQARITIPILDGDDAEVPETFTVELAAPAGVTLRAGRGTATVTITDDDAPTAESTVEATTPVIADDTATSTVTVTLAFDAATRVISGTPTEERTTTTHTLMATETGGTEQVATLTFDLTVGAAGAAPAVTATISGPASVDEGGTAEYTVTLAGSPSAAVDVTWAVTNGGTGGGTGPAATDTEAGDFTGGALPTGTLSFAAGTTDLTQTFTVAIADDIPNNRWRNGTDRPWPASAGTVPDRTPAAIRRSIPSGAIPGFVRGMS